MTELSAFPVYAGSMESRVGPLDTQLSERMEREVRVDLQTRGGTRYQTDISIRGGMFEGTGLMVGGLALFDPQTGHYFSEIPLSPSFFSGARLLTGVRNSYGGFNATAGSIDWQWAPVRPGGSVQVTGGSDSLLGFGARVGGREELSSGKQIGWEAAVVRESGDGSLPGGDFDLRRLSGRLEWEAGEGILRIFGGYVDKFYGWPGMYTGFSSLQETDDYQVSLLGWQWETTGAGGLHRLGGYWRHLEDDYEFDRTSPGNAFEHRTEVFSLQGDGRWQLGEADLLYRWILVRDRILRSTSLVSGPFRERDYGEFALLAERPLRMGSFEATFYGGLGLETTDVDATTGSPMAGMRAGGTTRRGSWEAYLEYSQTSQVPGYTVLKSAPSGLFGGNADLGREKAATMEGGFYRQEGPLAVKLVLFHRRDSDLADWVFDRESPSARQAAAVDLEVNGVEAWLNWEQGRLALEAGYAFLEKHPDWKGDFGDASFYALNYARHRFIASVNWELGKDGFLRLEGEFRDHAPNSIRQGPDSHLSLNLFFGWEGLPVEGWSLIGGARNLTDKSFELVPGTPGPRREWEVALSRSW